MTVGTFVLYPPPILALHKPTPFIRSSSSDRWPRSVLKVKGHRITGGPHVRSDQCTSLLVVGMNSSALISLDTFPPLSIEDGGMVRWWCNEVGIEKKNKKRAMAFITLPSLFMVHIQSVCVYTQIFRRG